MIPDEYVIIIWNKCLRGNLEGRFNLVCKRPEKPSLRDWPLAWDAKKGEDFACSCTQVTFAHVCYYVSAGRLQWFSRTIYLAQVSGWGFMGRILSGRHSQLRGCHLLPVTLLISGIAGVWTVSRSTRSFSHTTKTLRKDVLSPPLIFPTLHRGPLGRRLEFHLPSSVCVETMGLSLSLRSALDHRTRAITSPFWGCLSTR